MSGEIYTKPGTDAGRLAWATTASGELTDFTETRKLNGWNFEDLVPYDSLNYRWNLLGDWEQFVASGTQRRFTSAPEGATTTTSGDVYWADDIDSSGDIWANVAEHENFEGSATLNFACDGGLSYFTMAAPRSIVSVAVTDVGMTEVDGIEPNVDFSSIYADGTSVFTTASGSTVKQYPRDLSGTTNISSVSGNTYSKFITNGYSALGWDKGVGTIVGIQSEINGTPADVGSSNHTVVVKSAALNDTFGFLCGYPVDIGGGVYANVRAFNLSTAAFEWGVNVGSNTTEAHDIATDGTNLFVVHSRTDHNIECLEGQTGTQIWETDAYESSLATGLLTILVDDKYVYASTDDLTQNYTYVLDKNSGLLVTVINTTSYSVRDCDGWFLYAMNNATYTIRNYLVSSGPKQFLRVHGNAANRRPFYKLGIPI